MLRTLLLLVILLITIQAQAQKRNCSTMDVYERQVQENPFLQQIRENIERQTQEFISNGGAKSRTVVTIPVVVHVVYNTAAENISQAQIESQLQVLNDDFRRLNADQNQTPGDFQNLAADCEINFCLATQTATGAATTGIIRVSTTKTSFSTNDAVKYTSQGGSNAWDRNKYLNIWVCDLSGGLLGYAQFPGGAAATDGVVIDYAYFGTIGTATAPFHKGRTGTHEVGHWLNLYHIWGDDGTSCNGTDQVADTPNQADENYGCPAYPTPSCNNTSDMFMNYMDYTDDACMNLFTQGQKARMQALFTGNGARVALTTSTGCQPPTGGGTCGTPGSLNATSITTNSATLNWGAVSGATNYNLQWKAASASSWTTVQAISATSYSLTGLSANTTYNFQVQANCNGTLGSYSASSSFTTQSASSCSDPYEPNNTRNTAQVIPVNTTFEAKIATSTDKDYYKFSNTTATPKIKVELTNLPADYDLRLYRNSTQVGISQNGGTLPETILLNTTTVSSNYVAYVYGYNNAFSATACYTFRVSLSASNFREDGSNDGEVETIEIPVLFEDAGFGLYPNPAAQEITIETLLKDASDVNLTIMDPAGRAALTQNLRLTAGENRFTVDINNLPNGVYFVQLRSGEKAHTRKLVVKN